MAGCCSCRRRGKSDPTSTSGRCGSFPLILFILSAIPTSLIFSLEQSTKSISYLSDHWFHECAKWDPLSEKFLVSTFYGGGLAEVSPDGGEEKLVVKDPAVAGYLSAGVNIDQVRKRVLVVYSDPIWSRYSGIGAYRLGTWDRIFLTQLAGPGDEPSLADDVAVDEEGNAYITDARSNKIWKLSTDGELLSVIKSDIFVQKKGLLHNFVGLNGIVYHSNGYLLVVHTSTGSLFRINTKTEEITLVKVEGSLKRGDGLELMSNDKLVVAGTPSRLVESLDDWTTARVVGRYVGVIHRIPSAATVKDGKVYLTHIVGFGFGTKKMHRLAEAIFTP
ncbi:Calcium-dependent phosphotriesterase superfamily protein [Rhynchospora pubera]|uniref:Calcium-dependent phosphotriesterase superfamily protein n=1 Tax=Rhynchospora pubera TaxID=906938 RepID=A0AAV8DBF4_9POAL|nr:Calcium-dependent phosphotriesterase superfamily protein [Rhynchospora pubera]